MRWVRHAAGIKNEINLNITTTENPQRKDYFDN
jgi:hypothetical protein